MLKVVEDLYEQAGWRLETSKRMWKAFVEFRSFHLLL